MNGSVASRAYLSRVELSAATQLPRARAAWRAFPPASQSMQFIFVAIGLSAGLLSGLFGIGGGIIIVPLLLLVTKMEPTTATGTSLMALLLPVGALAVWEYHKNGHVDVGGGLLIALGLFVGAYFGARVGLSLNPTTTKRVFAVVLV